MLRACVVAVLGLTASVAAAQPCAGPSSLSLELEGHDILVIHHDATYNCCMDIGYALTVEGARLILDESENPPGGLCDCICCYQLGARIEDVPAGAWTVVLRGAGFELSGTIVVPAGAKSGPALGGYGQSPCGQTGIVGIGPADGSWGALKARYR